MTVCCLTCFTLTIAGCAGGTTDPGSAPPAQQPKAAVPVTLKIAVPYAKNEYAIIAEGVKKLYPHITLEVIEGGTDYDKMLAAGTKPDILIAGEGAIRLAEAAGLAYGLEPLIKETGFDLSQIRDDSLQTVKNSFVDRSKLIALPFVANFNALYYNKGLFDRFGVNYPTDGMTWQDVIALARQLTRKQDGTAYRGIVLENLWALKSPLGLNYVDEKTNKASINTDGWKTVFETLAGVYAIPGNGPLDPKDAMAGGNKAFFENKTAAMFPSGNQLAKLATASDLNWGMVTYPVYEANRSVGPNISVNMLAVTSISEHKQEAFNVIRAALSKEVQQRLSAEGMVPVLKGTEGDFGRNLPWLKGHAIDVVFKLQAGKAHSPSAFNAKAAVIANNAFTSVVAGARDVNTALRLADEELNQVIAQELQK